MRPRPPPGATPAQGGALDPAGSGRSLGEWSELLRDRRDDLFPTYGEASPLAHAAWARYTIAGGNQIIHYVDPAQCAGPGFRYGVISISP